MRNANYPIFKRKSKENGQKCTFFSRSFSTEIQTLSPIISLKRAEFLVLMGIAGLGIM